MVEGVRLEEHLGPPSHERRSPRGLLAAWTQWSGLFVVRLEGTLDASLAFAVGELAHQYLVRTAGNHGFHDWRGLSDYEPAARVQLMTLTYEFRPRMDSIHFLAPEKRVDIALRAATALFPMFKLHEDAHSFLFALRVQAKARGARLAGVERGP